MENTEREPTIANVLRELRALRADRDEQLRALRADRDEQLGALRADHDEQLRALRADHGEQFGALRGDMELHGRETRRMLDGLPGAVAETVVAAVDRTFGAELRALREDVDALKDAAG